jgi:outer membrane protein OmpU
VKITGDARMGMTYTGSKAAIAAVGKYALTTSQSHATATIGADGTITPGAVTAAVAGTTAASDTDKLNAVNAVAAKRVLLATLLATSGSTPVAIHDAEVALADAEANLAAITDTAAVAAVPSKWAAANRVRFSFSGSGETDSGLVYGGSIRADNAVAGAAGTAGSAFISGAFGKLAMGDLDGADQALVGQVAYVGLTSLGSNNEVTYQSASHNVAYTYTAAGLSLALSTDTVANAAVGGSSYALGASYTTDMSGTALTVAAGTSSLQVANVTSTQNSASLAVSMNGLSSKVVYSKNNNGTAADTTMTALGMSYTMGQIGVDAFYATSKTSGTTTKANGIGVSYDMGAGMSAKAGIVRAANRNYADFGVKMSF